MAPKDMNNITNHSNNSKQSDLLPDMEDLGEWLKTRCPTQVGDDYQIRNRKNDLTEQGASVSVEKKQHMKDQVSMHLTGKPTQRQPKVRKEARKQEPKTANLKSSTSK